MHTEFGVVSLWFSAMKNSEYIWWISVKPIKKKILLGWMNSRTSTRSIGGVAFVVAGPILHFYALPTIPAILVMNLIPNPAIFINPFALILHLHLIHLIQFIPVTLLIPIRSALTTSPLNSFILVIAVKLVISPASTFVFAFIKIV